MFDTVIGVLGLAASAYQHWSGKKEAEVVHLRLNELDASIAAVQRLLKCYLDTTEDSHFRTIWSREVNEMALQIVRSAIKMDRSGNREVQIIRMNPQSINFLAAPPPLIAAKNMRTTLILPFAPLRMTRTAPDGYGELFVMNQNSPEMFNPQPILLRTPTDPTLSKTEWDVRLARIGESQKEKPEFLIDECYWEQRLSEIGAPQ